MKIRLLTNLNLSPEDGLGEAARHARTYHQGEEVPFEGADPRLQEMAQPGHLHGGLRVAELVEED